MPYRSSSIEEFAAAVAARTPAPASGSATAVAAALAAALAELSARFSDGAGAEEAAALRARLLGLADEDAEAYAEFMRTRSDEARSRTVDVPLELAEAAAEVVTFARRLEREGNPNLVGDAYAAAELARAAVRIGARLVEINVGDGDDPRLARVRALL